MPQHENPLLSSKNPKHVLTSPMDITTTRIPSSTTALKADTNASTATSDASQTSLKNKVDIAAKVDSANVDTHKLLTQRNSGKDKVMNREAGAVRFNLTISSSGRTYTCVRTMLKFIELRRHLLKEVEEKSGIKIPELPLDFFSFSNSSPTEFDVPNSEKTFSGWGFSMLQSMVRGKVKLMEEWLSYVCSMMPMSPSLSKFLWEPMTDGLGIIYESDENEDED